MKSVLISIQPRWCELIASGEKTLEVRKTKPKLKTPFKVYIYCTKSDDMFWVLNTISRRDYGISAVCANLKDAEGASRGDGKVIGEFVCDVIDEYVYDYCTHPEIGMDYDCGDNWWEIDGEDLRSACLTEIQFRQYAFPNEKMYGWHISKLKIYDKPKELSEFWLPPETYCEKGLCGGCPYDCVTGETGDVMFDCEWKRPLKRAPQSWCYVEENSYG